MATLSADSVPVSLRASCPATHNRRIQGGKLATRVIQAATVGDEFHQGLTVVLDLYAPASGGKFASEFVNALILDA